MRVVQCKLRHIYAILRKNRARVAKQENKNKIRMKNYKTSIRLVIDALVQF